VTTIITAAIAAKITKALLARMTFADVARLCCVSVEVVHEIAQQIKAKEAAEKTANKSNPVPQ